MDYIEDLELEEIEESKKDAYIENHFASLKENLEIIGNYFVYAMQDAIIIEKLIKSKDKGISND